MDSPGRASDDSGLRSIVLVAGTVAALYVARDVLIPLAVALTFTFLLSPLVRWLQGLRLPRAVAVLTVLLISTGLGAGVCWVLAGQAINLVTDLPNYRDNIDARIKALHGRPQGSLRQAADNVKEIKRELSGAQPPVAPTPSAVPARGQRGVSTPNKPGQVEIIQPPRSDLQYLVDLGTPVLRPLATVGLVLVFTFFMLMENEKLRNRLLRLAGMQRLHAVTLALDDAAKRVSKYLLLQASVNAGFGALFAVGLFFIGVPNAALWGALAAILRIVPYVGSLIAAAFPLVLSLAVFQGWMHPVLVVALFVVLELIIGNFIEPMLYGAHTGISPLAILVTTVFWTVLWGPAGLILSTPLTVCVGVLGRYIPKLAFLHVLLGDEPVLEPAALFYQRLLAFDQSEAHKVAESYLADHPLIGLYDSVLIPALGMSERARHEGSLSQDHEQFILLSFGEMIAEFSDYQGNSRPSTSEDSSVPTEPQPEQAQTAPGFHGRILCVPANDEADSITTSLLVQILEQQDYKALWLPIAESLQALQVLGPTPDDLICICALPPFAFARCKTLTRELRARFPNQPTIVGIWGFTGDVSKAAAQLEPGQPKNVLTTLAAVVERIAEIGSGVDEHDADGTGLSAVDAPVDADELLEEAETAPTSRVST
jgi:predicted PurR-regulated permease PerM